MKSELISIGIHVHFYLPKGHTPGTFLPLDFDFLIAERPIGSSDSQLRLHVNGCFVSLA